MEKEQLLKYIRENRDCAKRGKEKFNDEKINAASDEELNKLYKSLQISKRAAEKKKANSNVFNSLGMQWYDISLIAKGKKVNLSTSQLKSYKELLTSTIAKVDEAIAANKEKDIEEAKQEVRAAQERKQRMIEQAEKAIEEAKAKYQELSGETYTE